ncbi:acylneuraminate cytidylyltransferase family protein [Roseovarius sp. ZX-A-9]|uniref:acylneuraminate cytidylyltransferase family protein n=1 Tax=Roseovarius sp. ZX-A-9 TaxID=3014783 RepID=UPI00232C80B9|nr:acylneuraminate cytidylyltransferase family protein [Roseovarius sp. ZX-A-9]
MIDIAFITARAGSVGLPGKNIRPLGGRPLIAWTVQAALASGCFRRVVVSTDGADIAAAAQEAGAEVPFMRPAELAQSNTPSVDVLRHAIEATGNPEVFALLQPTSPFRSAQHIRRAAELFEKGSADALVSVSPSKPLSWHFGMSSDGMLRPAQDRTMDTRRQDGVGYFTPNGAIYICRTEAFVERGTLFQPETLGLELGVLDSLDIDELEDFQLAEAIVAQGLRSWTACRGEGPPQV